jgi:hypothetical protein
MSTTITLARPVDHDGKTFATINIDEPTVAGIEAYEDAKAAGKSEVGSLVAMLAVDTGWPPEALRKVRASDLQRISEAMAPFVSAPESGGSGAASAPTSPSS